MLRLVTYKSLANVFEETFFSENFGSLENIVFIAPGPTHADNFRRKLIKSGLETKNQIITISKFCTNELTEFGNEELLSSRKNKSSLMFSLAPVWKANIDDNFENFMRAFVLFTELRSYTADFDLYCEFLEFFDESQKYVLILFWKVCESLGYIDEHQTYTELSSLYRHIEYDGERNFVFIGFQNFTAIQIDYLKSLSIRDNISVLINEFVYEKCSDLDWPKWIAGLDDKEGGSNSSEKSLITKYSFPKNRLNEYLRKINTDLKIGNIVLATKNLDFPSSKQIPLDFQIPKVEADLFSEIMNLHFQQLYKLITEDSIEIEEFLEIIENKIKLAIENQNFREIKFLLLFKRKVSEWKEFYSENKFFSKFELKLFKSILSLDFPRSAYVSLSKEKKLDKFSTLEFCDLITNEEVYLIYASNLGALGSSTKTFPNELQSLLASVGPIKNQHFDKIYTLSKLISLGKNNKLTLILEEETENKDIVWNELLSLFEIENKEIDFSSEKVIKNVLSEHCKKLPITKLSATRLQSYLDCPQKYFYSYGMKLIDRVDLKTSLRADQIGTLEHWIIEEYFKKHSIYEEDDFITLCKMKIGEYLGKNKINLNKNDFSILFNEIRNYCKNGIELLLDLKTIFDFNSLEFEKKILHNSFTGSIDCILSNDTNYMIIDFKRSNASIPTKNEVFNFEKIQIWFYLTKLLMNKELLSIGYLNLSSKSDSLFINTENETTLKLKDLEIKNSFDFKEFNQQCSEYLNIEEQTIEKMKKDETFFPSPRIEKVCEYCVVKNFCTRTTEGEFVC